MIDKDKRTSLRNIMGVSLGAIAAYAAPRRAAAQQAEKLAQNVVQYQNTPKDGQECDKCVNWVAPNACKIVDGTINPKGYCVAFAPQGG